MILPSREVIDKLFESIPITEIWFPILFGGPREHCCDEAAVFEVDGQIVSLATIAPNGEMDSGEPTIVGLYTVKSHRRQGYGKIVFTEAVERCIERGFKKTRVDVLSIQAKNLVFSLPQPLQDRLRIIVEPQLIEVLELTTKRGSV